MNKSNICCSPLCETDKRSQVWQLQLICTEQSQVSFHILVNFFLMFQSTAVSRQGFFHILCNQSPGLWLILYNINQNCQSVIGFRTITAKELNQVRHVNKNCPCFCCYLPWKVAYWWNLNEMLKKRRVSIFAALTVTVHNSCIELSNIYALIEHHVPHGLLWVTGGSSWRSWAFPMRSGWAHWSGF